MERLFGTVIMVIALIAIFGMYAYVVTGDGNRTLPQRIKKHIKKHLLSHP